jgi:hypothetical protein
LPDWLIERGIGETRAMRVMDGEIVESRTMLDGIARAGEVREAKLKQAGVPAVATDGSHEYLLPKGAPGATEGSTIRIEITREAIPGTEPWKRPLARLAAGDGAPSLPDGETLPFPSPEDRVGRLCWDDLVEEGRSGIVRFEGGELRIFVTPAMTLIDVDGISPPEQLAIRAVDAAARAILRHSIGGSIGIDFPTLSGKPQRQAVGEAIDASLEQPFERTAMNGFGFVQIVRPRRYASTFELAQDRAAFEARALLRRAAFNDPGPARLVAHPAVVAALERKPEWLEALARQVGGAVTLRSDGALPIHGGYAEKI